MPAFVRGLRVTRNAELLGPIIVYSKWEVAYVILFWKLWLIEKKIEMLPPIVKWKTPFFIVLFLLLNIIHINIGCQLSVMKIFIISNYYNFSFQLNKLLLAVPKVLDNIWDTIVNTIRNAVWHHVLVNVTNAEVLITMEHTILILHWFPSKKCNLKRVSDSTDDLNFHGI